MTITCGLCGEAFAATAARDLHRDGSNCRHPRDCGLAAVAGETALAGQTMSFAIRGRSGAHVPMPAAA